MGTALIGALIAAGLLAGSALAAGQAATPKARYEACLAACPPPPGTVSDADISAWKKAVGQELRRNRCLSRCDARYKAAFDFPGLYYRYPGDGISKGLAKPDAPR